MNIDIKIQYDYEDFYQIDYQDIKISIKLDHKFKATWSFPKKQFYDSDMVYIENETIDSKVKRAIKATKDYFVNEKKRELDELKKIKE